MNVLTKENAYGTYRMPELRAVNFRQGKKMYALRGELFFCPECGTFSVRTGNACPKCGYEPSASAPAAPKPAVSAATPAREPKSTSYNSNELIDAWKKANPQIKVRAQSIKSRMLYGISSLILIVLFIVTILLIEGVIPPTKGIKNGNFSSVEFFARYDKCERLFDVLIGVVAALSLIAPICKIFFEYLPSIRCAAWLKKTGYDLKPYISDYKKLELGGRWTQSDQAAYFVLSKGVALSIPLRKGEGEEGAA